ncbi:MAG: hypothetical protein GC181_10680 [Bacteroidetes bacterium]|nr:hypothetical protein [Bacteroidota bacterium]
MNYKRTTQIPNVLIDDWLKSLSESELKILLVIIRRTIGMVDKTSENRSNRVHRAWISHGLFILYTGLSYRSVSRAIQALEGKALISITDAGGSVLPISVRKLGQNKLHYRLNDWQ